MGAIPQSPIFHIKSGRPSESVPVCFARTKYVSSSCKLGLYCFVALDSDETSPFHEHISGHQRYRP